MPTMFQDHHVLQQQFSSQPVLALLDYNINAASNRINLPDDQMVTQALDRPPHTGGHLDSCTTHQEDFLNRLGRAPDYNLANGQPPDAAAIAAHPHASRRVHGKLEAGYPTASIRRYLNLRSNPATRACSRPDDFARGGHVQELLPSGDAARTQSSIRCARWGGRSVSMRPLLPRPRAVPGQCEARTSGVGTACHEASPCHPVVAIG